jgi:hypothetical protein
LLKRYLILWQIFNATFFVAEDYDLNDQRPRVQKGLFVTFIVACGTDRCIDIPKLRLQYIVVKDYNCAN